jgi:hypothetical protein
MTEGARGASAHKDRFQPKNGGTTQQLEKVCGCQGGPPPCRVCVQKGSLFKLLGPSAPDWGGKERSYKLLGPSAVESTRAAAGAWALKLLGPSAPGEEGGTSCWVHPPGWGGGEEGRTSRSSSQSLAAQAAGSIRRGGG